MTQQNFTVDYGLTIDNGNLVATTPNNDSGINFVGNSSGDGGGYTTMQLVPDDTLTGGGQYLIIDPTGGGHIHIRAGGAQDNATGILYLGGENSYVQIPSGPDPNVLIAANASVWNFDNTGVLTLPSGEGRIQSIDDTVSLISYNTTTGNANSVYLGSGGGLGFFDQEIGGNWLEIFRNGAEPEIRTTAGNINLQTANGATAYNWVFSDTGNLTLPGNSFAVNYANGTAVSLGGNYGNANVATFLAAYGSNTISTTGNITAGNLIGNIQLTGNIQGTSSNVTLVAGSYSWTFDNTGNLQGNLSLTGANITINNAPGGAEGAEISWALPAVANTTLNGSVVQDVFTNGMRFFESGGTSRGLYMDLGNAPAGAGTAVGYRDIPQIAFSANATAAANAAGCHYYSTTAGNLALTLPDNSSVAFPTGATLTIVVNAAGNVLVNQGSGVSLYQAGASATGNRVVGAYGLATVMKVAANVWVISGTGVY